MSSSPVNLAYPLAAHPALRGAIVWGCFGGQAGMVFRQIGPGQVYPGPLSGGSSWGGGYGPLAAVRCNSSQRVAGSITIPGVTFDSTILLTMIALCRYTGTATDQTIWTLNNGASFGEGVSLEFRSTGAVRARSWRSSSSEGDSPNTVSSGQWCVAGAVFRGLSDRDAVLNGQIGNNVFPVSAGTGTATRWGNSGISNDPPPAPSAVEIACVICWPTRALAANEMGWWYDQLIRGGPDVFQPLPTGRRYGFKAASAVALKPWFECSDPQRQAATQMAAF